VNHLVFECQKRNRERQKLLECLRAEKFGYPFDIRDVAAVAIENGKFDVLVEIWKFAKLNEIEI
jgi:ribosome recycling factor